MNPQMTRVENGTLAKNDLELSTLVVKLTAFEEAKEWRTERSGLLTMRIELILTREEIVKEHRKWVGIVGDEAKDDGR